MQLNPTQQATLDQAVAVLADQPADYGVMAAGERIAVLSWNLGNVIAILGDLANQPDSHYTGDLIQSVLDAGYQLTVQKRMDARTYFVTLTSTLGAAFSGETSTLFEALSHAVVAAGIEP